MKRESDTKATTSNLKRPDPFIFFIDRNLGREKFPSILRNNGIEVRIHDKYLPQDAKDEEWLNLIGKNQWIGLTRDKHIKNRKLEREALSKAKAGIFVFVSTGLSIHELANLFISILPKIRRFVENNRPPFIAKIMRGRKVKLLYKEDM